MTCPGRVWPWLALVMLFINASPGRAAFERLAIGARPAGMGGAYVALADDAEALFHNPAGMARIPGHMIGVSFSRPFGLDDLGAGSLAYVRPGPAGRCGISWNSFGNRVYRENTCGLSAGGCVLDGLCLGATSKIHMLSISGYGSASSFDLDVGFIFRVSGRAQAGLSVLSLAGSGQACPPRQVAIGLRLRSSDELVLSAQIERETGGPILFRAGQEYRISGNGSIRCGMKTHPTELSGGVSICFNRQRIDYACVSHPVLGLTHILSLTIGTGASSTGGTD